MFTGIVQYLGTAASVTDMDRGRSLVIDAGPAAAGTQVGDSVAINGTCLTVVDVAGNRLGFDVTGETLDRTNLGELEAGQNVNIELPMAATGRFDGHIVQGHVDGVGEVRSASPDGAGQRMLVDLPSHLLRYVVEKGSITLDGVSLTVAGVDGTTVEVALIPHTLAVTTLGSRSAGDTVNIEVDVLAKYVERLLGASL